MFTDPPVQSERGDRWNMDYVWFSKYEARLWLPKDPKEGDKYHPSSPYSATKASADHIINAYIRTYNLPIMISN